MNPPSNTLKRVLRLYKAIEEMNKFKVDVDLASVREVEKAIELHIIESHTLQREALALLAIEDSAGWRSCSAAQEEIAVRDRRLTLSYSKRCDSLQATTEKYIASRFRRQQMSNLVDSIVEEEKHVRMRREQTRADDRFLSISIRKRKTKSR